MAKRQVVRRLNQQPKDGKPILNTPAGMYAPDWDNPAVQAARVLPKSEQPRRIQVGNDGIIKRGR